MCEKLNDDWIEWERQIEIMEFYFLAMAHGFCYPKCGCKDCKCVKQQS